MPGQSILKNLKKLRRRCEHDASCLRACETRVKAVSVVRQKVFLAWCNDLADAAPLTKIGRNKEGIARLLRFVVARKTPDC
jgi:hypothetical protein